MTQGLYWQLGGLAPPLPRPEGEVGVAGSAIDRAGQAGGLKGAEGDVAERLLRKVNPTTERRIGWTC
jgi:hypothetical protein